MKKRSLIDPRFTRGLELFNHREFFECHEVIEALWLKTPQEDPYRDLYKGVIQAAAALHIAERKGPLSGALGLYRTSILYLSNYLVDALGLDAGKLVEEMRAFFEPLEGRSDWGNWKMDDRPCPRLVYL